MFCITIYSENCCILNIFILSVSSAKFSTAKFINKISDKYNCVLYKNIQLKLLYSEYI